MSRRTSRPAPAAARPPEPRARALAVAALLAAAGVVLSLFLARLHARAHAGFSSFCAISDVVNCDRVATSHFSVFLGLPVAVWGVLGYAVAGGLAGRALVAERRGGTAGRGLLLLAAVGAVAVSVLLAVVSKVGIGAWCLLCIGSWAIAVALLAVAWRACATGPAPAIAADLRAAIARPALPAALAIGVLAVALAARAAYPHYWAAKPAPAAAGPGPGDRVLVEFSDYECPFCARAHGELARLRAARPDLEIVRRQFPLDPACNPAVKRAIHPGACVLARAALCADAQGRFAQMDDALFANQKEHEPAERLASRIGLDAKAFDACMEAPATAERLAREVASGIQAGVRATPWYVIGGKGYAGELPPQIWNVPSGAAPPRPDAAAR